MKPEYEARFLGIDTAAVVDELKKHSAVCQMPRTLMRRIVFTNTDITRRRGWLRLRSQGARTFLTYKQIAAAASAIDSTLEAEVEVADFDAARGLLEAMGFAAVRYQENYREEWQLNGATYDIDTWPDLPTFLEVEGRDEAAVHRAAQAVGLDPAHASYGSVDEVYLAVLGRDILNEPTLTFENSASSERAD